MLYFSLATLLLGIAGAGYLLLEWIHHRRERRFALLWSVGLFLLFWFQIPAILSHANQSFTLTDFNIFFSFAFPISFVGNLLIYAGILSVTRPSSPRRAITFVVWAAVATILFFFFFANQNTISSRAPTFIFIFLFFMPLHILVLVELRRWWKSQELFTTRACYLGIAVLMASYALGIFQNVFVLDRSLRFPPEFWFLAVADSSALFIMQSLGTLLLLVGFFFVHQSCCKISHNRVKS
ncbi:MAG: hypothetical protein A2945_01385 [Candidatus Liptonbacteria bacterium RIFCSPLOWO2_01_FULL_52_25]|uniref:Histidine kinase N-terminal 7TM region domain-containing protein n=1 Tax=Candidatus Liptonbacteria bacterium RIFCSPLOWO2_01_FULL_52_25 TaxID=1798650 RepID=A0A1G2CDL6_9BACT|nr:MAG: hypothetical protein A2945_01385 [Candidatus Liptonbacteria bacterium RIFCSPLOWO2_01_FULL_52_25]